MTATVLKRLFYVFFLPLAVAVNLGLGLVILIPSGLCTASMGIISIGSMFSAPGGLTSAIAGLFMTVAIGGPFVLFGLALIHTGLRGRWPK